jgi:TonB family protein
MKHWIFHRMNRGLLVIIFLSVAVSGSSRNTTQAQRRALYAPRPEYRSAIGPGMVFSHVKFVRMGTVASVDVLRSTGHQMLDQAAIMAFRQWRFSPEI